ncbi:MULTISPECIES: DegT/DnrJ/EryC1/StrS family aminotransferase [Micromonospora]|uniref:DegT/DnrJ/EryC1/StrS family aminotransferase n=1 Tax=Micromonospora chalcea TaxID=1874 RepID=A0ABX9Y6F4_MICCH|nr:MULTISPECIES: DegT/DnrJ/EryC1/StrS family aminotransferase [Micromonospora]NHO80541.1 DegT/DnrJ/EryC1/StrS family aminotransferase [Micromonospora sp. CMU55-4]ODB81599.1 hypothetical protein A8711_14185 [Micromonospora sp. II]RQW94674.1 DegT/DnrJ/EryC1/StrS family aminotransferase [Micromonospora chalcea]RQX49508.1 DegT/DnrJ/EryC1/StrS family aminotransferase [Micromonospora chalcea]WBB83988.1 DegT/DnrJ/EryC1/StrS family aminotransferase [Micromonospora sp. WMMC264]
MTPRIPLSRPALGPLERRYVEDALASGWISGTGPYLERFEAAIAERVRRSHVVAVSSGTTALELTLAALGIGPGNEVIVPALTFVAPAAAVLTVGAVPVLCDVSPVDWTIDPVRAGDLVTSRTRAMIAVNTLGHPCDHRALARLGIPVIEDAAQSHGAAVGASPAGSFGRVSVFSFHANKAVTSGEGGCVATDDGDLAARIRLLANHAMSPDRPYVHHLVGRNGRMTNLTAALGLAQAQRWDELVDARRRIGDRYVDQARELGLGSRPTRRGVTPSCWLHTVVTAPETRNRMIRLGRDAGIDVRAIWPALPSLDLYSGRTPRPCPVAVGASASAAWLPTSADLTDVEIETVVERVLRPVAGASA